MTAPIVKVARDGKMWGVKVKWPRSGPWRRTMWFPRFVWQGPIGNDAARWVNRSDAQCFADLLQNLIDERVKP